jgi:hypothetical protein
MLLSSMVSRDGQVLQLIGEMSLPGSAFQEGIAMMEAVAARADYELRVRRG